VIFNSECTRNRLSADSIAAVEMAPGPEWRDGRGTETEEGGTAEKGVDETGLGRKRNERDRRNEKGGKERQWTGGKDKPAIYAP